MIFTTIVFFFPTTPSTTSATMNYTVVVLGGWIVLSLVGYYFPVYGGYKWFTGPRVTLDEEDMEAVREGERERSGSVRSIEKDSSEGGSNVVPGLEKQ